MALVLVSLVVACDPNAFGPKPTITDAGTSPNTSSLPRLDDPAISTVDGGMVRRDDAGEADGSAPPPKPLEIDEPPPNDRVPQRDFAGLVLEAQWTHRDVAPATSSPQIDGDALERARRQTQGGWTIKLTTDGRMRIDIASKAQPLPPGTALLGKRELLGWVILWPDGRLYRSIPPGAARTLLGESRVDMSPAATAELQVGQEGKRLDLPTQMVTVSSPVGEVAIELASIPEAESAGASLCRLLVEVAGATPSSNMCTDGRVPLRASYRWEGPDGGSRGVSFEVTGFERRTDLEWRDFHMRPTGAKFVRAGLPSREGLFFDADELRSFRKGPGATPNPPDPRAPEEGMVASNRSDRVLYLWVDGVPVATVDPWAEQAITGLLPGRYRVQWRSFLDDFVEEPSEHDLPARVRHGSAEGHEEPDAG